MIVVIDSNVWLSTLALRSSLGAAVLFFISQRGWTIAVPEVVLLEVEANLRGSLAEAVDSVQTHHRKLLAIFGKLKEVVLPTQEDIERVVSGVFAIEQVQVRHLPFTQESAKDSFLRTIDKRPPSHRSQQFKDGVIWADCLALLSDDDVILVTNDKAFFEGDDLKQGLSKRLLGETTNKHHRLTVMSELPLLLEEVRVQVNVDPPLLLAALRASEGAMFANLIPRHGFTEGTLLKCSNRLFATADASKLHLEFELEMEAVDVTGQGRTGGVFMVSGSGRYAPRSTGFEAVQSNVEELRFNSVSGEEVKHSIHMASGNIVLGHADISHTVRHRL